jgi:hypothetical protein
MKKRKVYSVVGHVFTHEKKYFLARQVNLQLEKYFLSQESNWYFQTRISYNRMYLVKAETYLHQVDKYIKNNDT